MASPSPSPAMAPPAFQEASQCEVCHCSFTAFRRRHHCRCCGRTFCHDHSSYQMPLPQFGLFTDVRVCYDCFNSRSKSAEEPTKETTSDSISSATESISGLNLGETNSSISALVTASQTETLIECKCGMPLCICEAPKESSIPVKTINSATSTVQSTPLPNKPVSNQQSSTKGRTAPSSSNSSVLFNHGKTSTSSVYRNHPDYDVSGEGLREAIKNGDANAVQKLLSAGVDANYCDKQGFSLLHLAALFNQTEIVFILMDAGADVEHKNNQGETPLDCAPAMLQYKMQKRLEELASAGKSSEHS